MARVERLTPDLSGDVIGLGPQIQRSWRAQPEGLLRYEDFLWPLRPPHLGMREYRRDLDSLKCWTRSAPHRDWWRDFMRDTGGTGFWHEAYFMGGGIDAIYDDVGSEVGLAAFAPLQAARGPMFSARDRARAGGEPPPPAVAEAELYGS